MSNISHQGDKKARDVRNRKLAERLEKFAMAALGLVKKLPRTAENRIYGGQVIRASSSMGANYQEACGAESGRDFVHKIRTVLKEARESRHWLRLIYKVNRGLSGDVEKLGKECVELIKIFKTVINKFHS